MKGRATTLIPLILTMAAVVLTLYAYRDLPARPFAADDYQWLLNVRDLSIGQLARQAFDPGAQSHFYRPLIWLLFWAQTRAFGLDPRGFHAVSLGLHLLNAFLLGWLCYRLMGDEGRTTKDEKRYSWSFVVGRSSALVAMAVVALHPAPFEAVVWISAQSELLAAALLLAALHLWLYRRTTNDQRRMMKPALVAHPWSLVIGRWSVLATLALGLALLAKESAVIGLPLLMLLGQMPKNKEQTVKNKESKTTINLDVDEPGRTPRANKEQSTIYNLQSTIYNYLLPTLLTLAYVALQIGIERRNYLLAQGGYGLGAQIVLNPLRSLALIVAPLPGTEHADAAWLIPVGALVTLVLLFIFLTGLRFKFRHLPSPISHLPSPIVVALALTLLPTAPFTSPPDSRYLYQPVMAAALLITLGADERRKTKDENHGTSQALRPSSFVLRPMVVLCSLFFVLALAWWAAGELHAREGRFAAASGPGGSLWRVATAACAESRPDRMVIVEPPVAAPHVEAIVELACGDKTRTKIVGGDQVEGAIKGHTVVIAFPNGSAEVQRRT